MARLTKSISRYDHFKGPLDAPVQLVEYGDFQCPYCGAAFPVLREVINQMGNRMVFAFRHFPLTETHEYAEIAAEAAEAAAAQNKFWDMHDAIYSNQDLLNVPYLYELADELGIDLEAFEQDLDDHTYEQHVREDFLSGVRSGVNGTPTLFINGVRYERPVQLNPLMQALKEAAEKTQV